MRILYPTKLFFKNEGDISRIIKTEGVITTRLAQYEMLKGILKVQTKEH